MATAGLGSMRNVAEQPAQTIMRADGLQQVLGGWRRLRLRTAHQENRRSRETRTSFAEVPGRSGKPGINYTH